MWSRCGVLAPMSCRISNYFVDLATFPSRRLKARHLKRNGSETSSRHLSVNLSEAASRVQRHGKPKYLIYLAGGLDRALQARSGY